MPHYHCNNIFKYFFHFLAAFSRAPLVAALRLLSYAMAAVARSITPPPRLSIAKQPPQPLSLRPAAGLLRSSIPFHSSLHTFYLFLLALLTISFHSCTLSGTSWDLDGTGPVMETTFNLSQAIGDENLAYQPDSAVFINFNDTVYTIDLDSLAQVPDTTYLYTFKWTLPNFSIPPGTTLPPIPIKIKFGLGNRLNLTAVRIKSGKLKIKICSLIPRNLSIQFSIPDATYYGTPFSTSETIQAAPSGDTTVLEKIIDLTNYYIDLRGSNQNEYNVIYLYISPTIDPNAEPLPVVNNQVLFSIENKLLKVKPFYGQGYVKNFTESINSNFLYTGISKFIKGGLLDIDSVRLGVKLINTMGVDMRIRFDQIRSINDLTGVQKYLTHPMIGNYINLQMAQNLFNPDNPVQHYDYTLWFTPQNSNLDQLIENIPDRLRMNALLEVNPLNNTTANNNFFYTTRPPQIAVSLQAPLKFSVYQLRFVDTLTNPLFDEIQLDRFLSGTFTLIAENKFPLGFALQLYPLNDAGLPTDTLLANNVVAPAPVNANLRVEQPLTSTLTLPFDETKAQQIKLAKKILLKARFTSVPNLQLLQMYSDYYLRLKLLADVKYRVVL